MEFPANQVLLGNCAEVLKTLPDNAIDAVVSDPPYGLGTKQPTREDIIRYLQGDRLDTGGDFMGKDWEIPPVSVWEQCYRVLKPGGHLLVFAGTRTFDVMSVGIRAAGFECRDTVASMFGPSVLQWVYSQGFPKGLDVAKAIDKMLKVRGKVVRTERRWNELPGIVYGDRGARAGAFVERAVREPESDEAKKWVGWGTSLKPAWEPILCFRKPPETSTVRAVLEHGVGGLNIGECRIGTELRVNRPAGNVAQDLGGQGNSLQMSVHGMPADAEPTVTVGRWPANVLLNHTVECKPAGSSVELFPRDDEGVWACAPNCPVAMVDAQSRRDEVANDEGASRFFTKNPPESSFYYTAKANRHDRNEGLDVGEEGTYGPGALVLRDGLSDEDLEIVYAAFPEYTEMFPDVLSDKHVPNHVRKYFRQAKKGERGNLHVTVKPVALMRWLVRLVCPKGGVVLDPYAGSGTTLVAAAEEGAKFLGIELDPTYHKIASRRAAAVAENSSLNNTDASIFDLAMSDD